MLAVRRVLITTLTLLAVLPAAAHAAFAVSGTWERIGEKHYRLTVRNDGDPFKTMFVSPVPHSGCTIAPPGSCGPNGDDEIRYTLEQPLPTGQSVSVEFTTSSELPDGTVLKVRVRQEDMDSGYFDVPQKSTAPPPPPPAAKRADLGVAFSTGTPESWPGYDFSQKGKVAVQILTVRLTNHGPDDAEDVVLTISGRRLPARMRLPQDLHFSDARVIRDGTGNPVDTEWDWKPAPACEVVRADVYSCRIGKLPARGIVERHLLLLFTRPGAVEVGTAVTSSTHDPGPQPNTATHNSRVVSREISDVGPIDFENRDTFEGRASAPVKVELAVVESQGGASVGPRTLQTGGAQCRWLRFSGAFETESDEACDEPVWLRAKSLGKGRFRLKLRRKLKKGSYRLIVRTVGDDGTHGIGRRAVRSFRIR